MKILYFNMSDPSAAQEKLLHIQMTGYRDLLYFSIKNLIPC